ncbi:DUF5938 domain-containing protein, partial [Klebsiella variicola]|uniref:DUF5938 domain-containing protein n=1 Tax=Klebsiella variicola TaxID=244366 RepID=UPI0027316FEF
FYEKAFEPLGYQLSFGEEGVFWAFDIGDGLFEIMQSASAGPLTRVHVVIHGNSNYKQTGLLQAYAAYSLIQQPPKRAGFASAGQAFGHRELLGVLQSFGFVGEPIVT